MRILILIPAPLKDKHLKALSSDFIKRASSTFPTEIKVLRGERIPPKTRPEPYLEKEAARIRQATPPGYVTVALTPEGKTKTSEAFSRDLQTKRDRGVRGIAFWIGSGYGLDQALCEEAKEKLSLSAMTLPHQLAVTVLTEQLYRAHAILSGSPYHK